MMAKTARYRRCLAAAMTAAMLAAAPATAAPGPGPQPYFGVPLVPPFFAAPLLPHPQLPNAGRCDGSEPVLGGLFGAAAGGLLAAVLGKRHGRADPGATIFGVTAGAMIGATLAASGCPAD